MNERNVSITKFLSRFVKALFKPLFIPWLMQSKFKEVLSDLLNTLKKLIIIWIILGMLLGIIFIGISVIKWNIIIGIACIPLEILSFFKTIFIALILMDNYE